MAAPPFRVKAVFDYASQHEDDLSFSNGQIITVNDEEDDDWYYGEYPTADGQTKQGLFPRNFVERYEPTTPPRPTRQSRPRKEAQIEPEPEVPEEGRAQPNVLANREEPQHKRTDEGPEPPEHEEVQDVSASDPQSSQVQGGSLPIRGNAEEAVQSAQPALSQATKHPQQPSSMKGPPPIASKPTSSAFRDRIAAFDKRTAAPIQPSKPGQSFASVKKSFVAAPPSRDAYVRPPPEVPQAKVFKVQEDPSAQNIPAREDSRVPEAPATEDQPKPTSLKERIALLQQQQLEQAARHADAAQKKEKPKKPTKKKSEQSADTTATRDDTPLDRAATGAASIETEDDISMLSQPSRLRSRSKERTPVGSPPQVPQELMSDSNDADQSAGGETEEGEIFTSSKKSSRPLAPAQPPVPFARPPAPAPSALDEEESEASEESEPLAQVETAAKVEEEDGGVEDVEEEEEMDPEIKRRMEIRDRMAKMSGGMGMAGMFGGPAALPAMGAKKSKPGSGTSKKQSTENDISTSTSSPPQPVPIMALPGMAMPGINRVKTPELMDGPKETSAAVDRLERQTSAAQSLEGYNDPDDDEDEATLKERLRSPPLPTRDGSIPAIPAPSSAPSTASRGPPPPPPSTRPSQPPPALPSRPTDPGFESDDELSAAPQESSTDIPSVASPSSRPPPPLPPVSNVDANKQSKTARSPTSPTSYSLSKPPTSPQSPVSSGKRTSRAPPPVPGAAAPVISPPPQIRAPPPPPPPTRDSDHPPSPPLPSELPQEESEEVTEYEGDYDTDIAAGETHKDALKADDQSSSADDTLTGDEASYHHPGLPSLGPPTGPPPMPSTVAPRGAPPPPPPPPSQPPRPSRQSSEAPRAPPPPGQSPSLSRQSSDMARAAPIRPPVPAPARVREDDYDPYNYNTPPPAPPPKQAPSKSPLTTPRAERLQSDFYDTSASAATQNMPADSSYAPQPPIGLGVAQSPQPRQSLDIPRSSTSRRSVDATRSSMEHSFMATDLDFARNTQWWVQRNMPPPALQDRPDVTCEVEETTAISQSGEQLVMRHVYALYLDYSQTVLTARFNPNDPSRVEFDQRHQPPPSTLRQDQLEMAHGQFGVRLAEAAKKKENSVVGNGTPAALVLELFRTIPDALPPIGTRAFGALVYTNLANASVQLYDEIRKGDIVTFRNAKFQGHKGGLNKKYHVDIGKPDHVAVVEDWDGTRKKIKAWEQGRDGKKVKLESFRLEDLRSGEIKVWREVSREWVGWGRKS